MTNLFLVIQIVFSLLLVFLIIIQGKGSGLDRPFFGSIGIYSTRRGVEKIVFYVTIAVATLFFLSSIIQLLIG
ncbi:preprotein translocase subunit SecG [Candidatus Shapirobacteria bacterium CG10_big_fil_rev_8_21_14_0_10_38_14]|uniref:Protein-export membrane protein SecG n=1 Tax=Candidatus Shapirobacteria bacterium CG10_big_fil_rev_8_21_14_0_10_38_14 TaxID=1974483 RepID=A0A2M8L6B6_9BACT|nr:MAG: preprotein translocase subunit SecG [Candidatus Shapirobacteria bacterium CG10_big_fil_rev_8_21_14_0_10_38_14]